MDSQDTPSGPEPGEPNSNDTTLRDWMTVWHSEMAAMGVDREMQESWARMAEAWNSAATQAAAADMLARTLTGWAGLDPAGSAGADAAPRPAAASHASDAGDELETLRRELASLRSRVERLESGLRPRKRRQPAGT